jgi:hypothetical protein
MTEVSKKSTIPVKEPKFKDCTFLYLKRQIFVIGVVSILISWLIIILRG